MLKLLFTKEFLQVYKNLSIEKDKEQLIRLAKNYKDFWDINNGKTLCLDCHGVTYKQRSNIK